MTRLDPSRRRVLATTATAAPGATAAVAELDDDDDEDDMTVPANLAAGALAGLVAETVMHPFETLSTRAKVHPSNAYGGMGAARLIVAEEGLRGLFAGLSVTLMVAAPATAVYFGVYEAVKAYGLKHAPEGGAPVVHSVAGASAEFVSSALFVPFEVVKSKMQLGANPARATGGRLTATRNYSGVFAAFRRITSREGAAGLVAGWKACLLQDCVFSALQFMVYEEYVKTFRRIMQRDLRGEETLLAGGVAGGVAAFLTNPLDLTTTRLMAQGTRGAGNRFGAGIAPVLRQAWREGASSLWRGSLPRVIAQTPLAAIQFAVYETAKRYFNGTEAGGAVDEQGHLVQDASRGKPWG